MIRTTATVLALLLTTGTGVVAAAPNGDALLARAATLPGLHSYSVPVHFEVHVHKPIGLRVGVEGTAYYRAPASAALAITKAPAIVGGMFRGTYQLDVVPQAWPQKYHVVATSSTTGPNGRETFLTAVPREPGDVTQAVFTLGPDRAPLAAQWSYKDGSTITVTFTNAPAGGFMLPATASVAVAMPSYHLEANATYGTYAFNEPVADAVFIPTK